MNKTFDDFISYYSNLSEQEKYAANKYFNEKTKGKLSQYNNPTPVAVALIPIEIDGQIGLLGVRRGINPKMGEIALPGGFQDFLEHAHQAACREVEEECSLITNPNDYEIFGNPLTTPTNNSIIFLKYKFSFGKEIFNLCKLNHEVLEFVFITPNTPICFETHKQKINEFFESQYVLKLKNKF